MKIKKEFNKKLAILNEWLEDNTLKEKKKEFHLVNNQTNDLLEDALNFRDSFYDGKIFFFPDKSIHSKSQLKRCQAFNRLLK